MLVKICPLYTQLYMYIPHGIQYTFIMMVVICWEVPKTTLKFNNSLERLAELSKAVIVMVIVCYRKQYTVRSVMARGT